MTRKSFLTVYLATLVASIASLSVLAWLLMQALNKSTQLEARYDSLFSQFKIAQDAVKRFEARQADEEVRQREYAELEDKYLKLLAKNQETESENISQLARIEELTKRSKELQASHAAELEARRAVWAREHTGKVDDLKGRLKQEREKLIARFRRIAAAVSRRSRSEVSKYKEQVDRLEKEIASRSVPLSSAKKGGASKPSASPEELDQLRRKNAVAHYNLGVVYLKGGDPASALKEFEQSLALNPDDPLAHYNLAYVYEVFKKDFGKAIRHYQAYLRLKPDAEDVAQVEELLLKLRMREHVGVDGVLRVGKS